jgi:hypothetical protein
MAVAAPLSGKDGRDAQHAAASQPLTLTAVKHDGQQPAVILCSCPGSCHKLWFQRKLLEPGAPQADATGVRVNLQATQGCGWMEQPPERSEQRCMCRSRVPSCRITFAMPI